MNKKLTLAQRVRDAEILIAALLLVDESKHIEEKFVPYVRKKLELWLEKKPVFPPTTEAPTTGKLKTARTDTRKDQKPREIQLPPDSITQR